MSEPIAAVSRLGQRVGTKTKTGVRVDDVIDNHRVLPGVKVIHKLSALVAQKTRVFKTSGAFHALNLT